MCPLSKYLKQINSILPEHADISVSALEEGFSNQTYLISYQHEPQLVLRIAQLDAQAFAVDREAELAIWQLAADHGLSSAVRWHDAKGTVVSDFILGHTLAWDVEHAEQSLELYAIYDSMKTLHQMPPVAKRYDVYQLIDSWLLRLERHPNVVEIAPLLGQVKALFQSLTPVSPSTLVLCHNDLNPKNMLLNQERAWFIDWECAGMNDPLFDLAVLSHCHHLTPTQVAQAYQYLFDEPLSAARNQVLTQYRQAYVIRELVWLLLKHLVHGSQDLDCLQWYHALLNDPVFNPYFKVE
ncbi:choline kinase family protein [Marinomonas ostreistagni]|uniref:choline kinase family protein n=1 Tax=Marinomonas ostreistagni TaxID=359209 RepID=UPI001950BE6A|nr:choline kinase family protein [Marinomonas ostreistagni]MBM6551385.1 phosphotransferase [Marinomonas ostreistagni]